MAKVPPASAPVPVLATVTFMIELLPVPTFPKANGLGDAVAVSVGATPVPVRETGEPVTVALV